MDNYSEPDGGFNPESLAHERRYLEKWVMTRNASNIANIMRRNTNNAGDLFSMTQDMIIEKEKVHKFALSRIHDETDVDAWGKYLEIKKAYAEYLNKGIKATSSFNPFILMNIEYLGHCEKHHLLYNHKPRTWLIRISEKTCQHYKKQRTGCIKLKATSNAKLLPNEMVFVFIKEERRIRYCYEVIDTGTPYSDNDNQENRYYTLKFQYEIISNIFDEQSLKEHGFISSQSLIHPKLLQGNLLKHIKDTIAYSVTKSEYYGFFNTTSCQNPKLTQEQIQRVALLHFALIQCEKVRFTYTKTDGTHRPAFGVKNRWKILSEYGIRTQPPEPQYPHTEDYFDYARMDWRRLRIDNLISVDTPIALLIKPDFPSLSEIEKPNFVDAMEMLNQEAKKQAEAVPSTSEIRRTCNAIFECTKSKDELKRILCGLVLTHPELIKELSAQL